MNWLIDDLGVVRGLLNERAAYSVWHRVQRLDIGLHCI